MREYEDALLGVRTHDHADGIHDHDHDQAAGHDHEHGCRSVGDEVRIELSGEDELPETSSDVDKMQELLASPEFLTYEQEWVECLGAEVLATNPLEHERLRFVQEAQKGMDQLLAVYETETDDGTLHRLSGAAQVSIEDLRQLAAEHTSVASLLDAEINDAVRDSRCRARALAAAGDQLQAAIASLEFSTR